MKGGDVPGRTTACQNVCGNIQVPTDEELVALNAMRAIKERVRTLKRRIAAIHESGHGEHGEELPEMEKEMARLREEWREWEEERRKAAKERMILLGHEEPNGEASGL
jgi:hypothetical protein